MIRKIALVVVLISLVCLCAQAADVSGKWKGSLVTPGGVKSYVYEFKVAGTALTGTATLNNVAQPISNGKIEGDKISFSEPGELNGTKLTIKYTGTVQGDKIVLQRAFGDFPPDKMTIKKAQ